MKEKFKLTPLERAWMLYDVGNSAFILLVSTLIPIFFNGLAEAGVVSSSDYLAYWGYAGSAATLIVAVLGPVFGTLADQKGFKKPLFVLCVAVGIIGLWGLGVVATWQAFLAMFVLARVGYNCSLVFYDAMLPEITTQERMDNVSSLGYAFGYIGSVIPFVLCLVIVLGNEMIGISMGTAMLIAFAITAIWWVLCTIPLLKKYRQTAYVEAKGNPMIVSFRQLWKTFQEAKKHKHIFVYLLSFFFFIDGVYTIIEMATAYGASLGLDSTGLLLALLWTQIVAFPCAIVFGRLAAKFDTGKLIKVCILCYTGIALFAVFLMHQWQFWLLATLVGIFQGGIQALSRSYLGKIVPAENSGEYFGLMDICGKGATFLGTFLIGVVTALTDGMSYTLFGMQLQSQSLAVASLVVIFIIGFVLFCKADKLTRARQ
jgi:UMF1 family MFS transporter